MSGIDKGEFGSKLAAGFGRVEKSLASVSRSIDATGRAFDAMSRAAERAQAMVDSLDLGNLGGGGSSSGSSSAAPAAAGQLGGDVAQALLMGLSPLTTIGTKVTAQLDRVGGTVVTLARRIDGALKFPAFEKTLDLLAEKVESPFAKGLISAVRFGHKAVSIFENMGDVAGRGLAKVSRLDFAAPIAGSSRLGREFRTMAPAVQGVTGSVRHLGTQIALALGTFGLIYKAVEGVKGFFGGGIKGAVDLNETLSKTHSIFGAAGDSIIAEADAMAKKFGIVKGEFIEGAVGIANMGKASSLTNDAAAQLGNTFAKLGADLSSQDNIPFAEAMEKLRSGLAGEAEPLRRFGVLLDESTVKAYAFANGIAKHGKELTSAEKVTARAALIQKGLARVTGDLAATVDQPARGFAKFTGTLTNLANEMGSAFLPAIQKGLGLLNELGSVAVSAYERNKDGFKDWVSSVVEGMDRAANLVRHWPDLWEIAQLKVGEFAENATRWIGVLMPNFQRFSAWLKDNWYKAVWDVFNGLNTAVANLAANIGRFAKAWYAFASGDMAAFDKLDFKPLLDGFKATADKLPDLLRPNLISMDKEIAGLWKKIGKGPSSFATGVGSMVGNAVGAASKALGELTKDPARAKGKGEGYNATAAVRFGSQEAYSAITRNRQQGNTEPIKEVVHINKQQLMMQQRMATALDGINTNLKATSLDLMPIA